MFVEKFLERGPAHSIHFSGAEDLPEQSLCDAGILVLEVSGHLLQTKDELIGSIEMGIGCPWFAEAESDAASNWDGFLDVLRSWTEWLSVKGLVVVFRDSGDLWSRMHLECGTLVELWLEATTLDERWSRPMHLVFSDEPFGAPLAGDGWERIRPFRDIEAIRWMPPSALKAPPAP